MCDFELVKLEKLSGSCCSIYSIAIQNSDYTTLLDEFINKNINSFKSETKDIVTRLYTIGHKTGARIQFFKENEGYPGDGVCALYDAEGSNLRLYCIRYGSQLVVIGSGGHKPKTIRSLQDDETLKRENSFMRKVSAKISERIKEKDIWFTDDGLEFAGNLYFLAEDF